MNYNCKIGDKEFSFSLDRTGNNIEVDSTNGETIDLVQLSNGMFHLLIDNQSFHISVTRTTDSIIASVNGEELSVEIEDRLSQLQKEIGIRKPSQKNIGNILAPIPGLVVRINVSLGDSVEIGTPLLALEAMKMENEIKSPVKGEIKKISVSEGQSVSNDSLLMVIK